MSDFFPELRNADPLTILAAIGIIVGGLLILCLIIAFLSYAAKCARRKDALLWKYEGFFTSWQAYMYTTYSMTLPLAPLFGIGALILSHFDTDGAFPEGMLTAYAGVCFVAFFIILLLKKGRERKLNRKYGPVAAKEIRKAMRDVGWGIAFGMGCNIFGTIAFESVNPQTLMTEEGEIVRVVQTSDTEWVDASGTYYKSK